MKSSANHVQKQPQSKFLKWIILLSFTEINFVNNIFGMMLVPLWGVLPIYFDVTQAQLNWITNWLYACPVIFSRFWNILILKNLGISMILSSIISAIGIWIAWYAKTDIFMTACGYFLIGVGNSLKCQIPLYISKMWFEPHERIITTFITQYACHSGYLFGYIFTSFFFYGLTDWNLISERISQLFFIMSILATISVPISFILLIKPAKEDQEGLVINVLIKTRDKLWSSYKKIYCTSESIFDLASAGSNFSFCWIYPALLGIQQMRLKQRDMDIFINGVTFQSFGIIMALICALRLDKQSKKGLQQNYDYYIKFLIVVGFSSLVFELLFLEMMHPQFLNFINCLIGGGLNSIYSVMLESLQEKHYPVQELVIGTVIQEIACLIALIFVFLIHLGPLLEVNFQVLCFFIIPGFCYIVVFYETKFNRFEFEA